VHLILHQGSLCKHLPPEMATHLDGLKHKGKTAPSSNKNILIT